MDKARLANKRNRRPNNRSIFRHRSHALGQEPELNSQLVISTLIENSLILTSLPSHSGHITKMGFLSSVVMGSSAFILGMVFVCQVVSPFSVHSLLSAMYEVFWERKSF